MGNHGINYLLYGLVEPCSGFRPSAARKLRDTFLESKTLFNVAYQYKNLIFSHAGITNQWWEWLNKTNSVASVFKSANSLSDGLNLVHRKLLHTVGKARKGEGIGSNVWADKSETEVDPLVKFHQVVGHTKVKDFISMKKDNDTSITYIDVLNTQTKFFEIEI